MAKKSKQAETEIEAIAAAKREFKLSYARASDAGGAFYEANPRGFSLRW